MSAFEFQLFDPNLRKLQFQLRNGETRVGEHFSQQNFSAAKYVLIGISENAGPQANLGRQGSENAFQAFSKVFFNTQFYPEVPLQNLAYLGQVKQIKQPLDRPEATQMVQELDRLIFDVLTQHVAPYQIPIIVGGGHNNALPLMRWASANGKLSVVNIDAHADLRVAYEGFNYSHASVMYNVLQEIPQMKKLVQVGIRDYCDDELILIQQNPQRISTFFDKNIKILNSLGRLNHELRKSKKAEIYSQINSL